MPALTPMQLLVVQPTPFCNLNCSYCYLPDRANTARMSDETLDAIGRNIVADPAFTDDTTLVWHAGEPCVLPPDWYRAAIARIEAAASRKVYRQSLQTNATLLSDDWIAYLKDSSVSVGVSLDGPADINDAFRVTRRGAGTHESALEGIKRLRAAGINFHIIAVITAQALARPEDIAHALADTGATSIGLNMEEVDGINPRSSLFEAETQDPYAEFLTRFATALASRPDAPRLREMDRVLMALAHGGPDQPCHHMENTPGAIITVDHNGGISTFSPELLGTPSPDYDDFIFGNVNTLRDLSEIYLGRTYLKALADIHCGVVNCRRTCPYFGLCGGGSPSNKLGETGRLDATETAFCRLSVKTTFEALMAQPVAGPMPKEFSNAPQSSQRTHA